jgi:molybdopterin-synthase adenylyltransferase
VTSGLFRRKKEPPTPPPTDQPLTIPPEWLRYSSSIRFAPLGMGGQSRLRDSTVTVLGLGALGSAIAEEFTRLGIGKLVLVDRDIVEMSNLSRQSLYTEADAREGSPKAIAVAHRLHDINPQVMLEPRVADVTYRNIYFHLTDSMLCMDGSDNFELRHLINQVSVSSGIPWIYSGVMGARMNVMAILPHQTPCLACLVPLEQTQVPTCLTTGVWEPAVRTATAMATTLAVQYLTTGKPMAGLFHADLWQGRFGRINPVRDANCPVCGLGEIPHLRGKLGMKSRALCSEDGVELWPEKVMEIDLEELYHRLAGQARVELHDYFLRLREGDLLVTLFPDGRALVRGTHDEGQARAVLARVLG